MEHVVVHDEERSRFSCSVDGFEGSIDYEMNDRTMTVFRTFVDPALRGRGIAERLMVHASGVARDKGWSILPTCSYAVQFFRRKKQWAALLSPDANLENEGSCRLPEKPQGGN